MAKPKEGDTVKVQYTGTLGDGSVFDSNAGKDPLEFVLGQGMVIAGFENAVLGLDPGDSIKVTLPAAEAYGELNEQLMFQVRREQIPPDIELAEEMMLEVNTGEGTAYVVVRSFDDELVTLDGNHPLAGKELTFDITLLEIA